MVNRENKLSNSITNNIIKDICQNYYAMKDFKDKITEPARGIRQMLESTQQIFEKQKPHIDRGLSLFLSSINKRYL